jgi:hypothetical protein
VRKAVIERNGSVYRDKQESLDHIDLLERQQLPIFGLEVVQLSRNKADSDMYKTIWYTSQDNVYDTARNFIREKMVGLWNYAEFK